MKYAALLLLFSVFIFSCQEEDPAVRVDLTQREKIVVRHDADVVTYAYLPQYSHTVSYTRHNPLIQYLKRETGLKVKQIFPDTFEQHMDMVGRGEIDISFSNPFIYIKIAGRYGAGAFARSIEAGGKTTFRGQIICRRDNPSVITLADCRHKRWIAVDAGSAGGFLYPLGHFIDHGIARSDFNEISFAPGPGGKQEKVILSVYAGNHDIGTIREGALAVVADRIDLDQIRIVATTAAYPGWVYAARKNLDAAVVDAVGLALEKLSSTDPAHAAVLAAAHLAGIVSATDADFDAVRRLAVKIGEGS